MIFIGEENYFMENTKHGEFQFVATKPMQNINFHIEANEVSSYFASNDVITLSFLMELFYSSPQTIMVEKTT